MARSAGKRQRARGNLIGGECGAIIFSQSASAASKKPSQFRLKRGFQVTVESNHATALVLVRFLVGDTPYFNMAANKLFFCLHVNYPSSPHFHFKILLFFIHVDEAKRAN